MSVTNDANSDEPNAQPSLEELPPSAKLVYKVLEYEGPMTQSEIATESRLCSRTVRYAVTKLEAADCIDSRASLRDARRSIYRVSRARTTA
ncbi:MarR family transcriptional regulator [Natrialbaceae archaeon A-CW1-1]